MNPADPTAAPASDRDTLINGVGMILLSSVMFGAMAVFARLASLEMSSAQVAFFRFAGSLLILLAVSRGRGLRPRRESLRQLALRGLLGAAAILLFFRGIAGAGAGFATLLQNTYPVHTALFAALFLNEPFTPRLAVSLVLNVAGAAVTLAPAAHLSPEMLHGGLFALAAGVLAGGAVAAARQLRLTESALLVTTHFMVIGAVVTAPFLLTGLPPWSSTLAMALAGTVLSSVAGQFLLHHGLGFAGAAQGAVACGTSVLSASLFEAVFLGQHLPPSTLAGAVLLIAAVALAARPQRP